MATQSATVLLSGGIDSALCAHMLLNEGHTVQGLFVDYGQRVAARERVAASAVAAGLGIELQLMRLEGGAARGSGELRGRNALLLSVAVFEMPGRDGIVACGIHAGTPYYDCSPAFADTMGRLIAEQSDGRLQLSCPLLLMSKKEVYEAFLEAGLPLDITYSCEAAEVACGGCASCLDRQALGC